MYQGAFVVGANKKYEQRDIDGFPETVVQFMAAPEPKPWFEETDDAKIFDGLMLLVEDRGPSDGWMIRKIRTNLAEYSSVTEVIQSIEGNFKVVKTKLTEGYTTIEQTVRFFGITPNQLRVVVKREQVAKANRETAIRADIVEVVERLILGRPEGVIVEAKPNGWDVHCGKSTVTYNRRTRSVSPVWGTIDNFLQMVENK